MLNNRRHDVTDSIQTKKASSASEKNKWHQDYGVAYIEPGQHCDIEAAKQDLYYYRVYIGRHHFKLSVGDCVYTLSDDKTTAHLQRGPTTVTSCHIATVIRGYTPGNKTAELSLDAVLPYVNGCATRQIFPPERIGDPTLQMLYMPPYTQEQIHHIHSTVRVVYVLSGTGESVVGMPNKTLHEPLYPGKVVVLQKLCPHHFVTESSHLRVMPLHIYSAYGQAELNHPMYHGTIGIT